MSLTSSVASFVAIFLLMIGVTLWLRYRGALAGAQGTTISAIITDGVLPAIIFCYVARAREQLVFLEMAAIIGAARDDVTPPAAPRLLEGEIIEGGDLGADAASIESAEALE
jgi:hypothetical protein